VVERRFDTELPPDANRIVDGARMSRSSDEKVRSSSRSPVTIARRKE
jgi:hypothetical protein